MREISIDSFAGGGGASTGYEMAMGRSPDIAINHDRFALAMHRANHPATRHMLQDVATVDAVGMCGGRPIGMLWMSPDCTDHSKAKGAAPRRDGDKTTRGIGWAIFGWVKALPKWQKPRVIFLENVEEYVDWGPLLPDGKRCPVRKGETFKAFVEAWRALGYVVEWRERRAWWSGSATIRKRLFMVMRRDGEPIVWPERHFGDPGNAADAARIVAGEMKPWPIVADCIDFSLPIPSIFDSSAEIKAKLGLVAKRPLAFNTMARVAKGVQKRVLRRRPFIVKVNHTARRGEARDRSIDMPLSALTATRDDAIVMPFVAYAQQGGGTRPADAPSQTFTASAKDQNVVIAPYLVPRYGERDGQEPRNLAVDKPGPTPVPTGNEGSLVAVSLCREFGNSVGSGVAEPVGTITAGGSGKTSLVAAFMAQHSAGTHPGQPSKPVDEPLSTLTVRGTQQNVVAVSMLTLRGSERRTAAADQPATTISSGGQHHALVSMPLMTVYYGTDEVGASVDAPGRTDTAKARFGLVEALAGVPPFSAGHEAKARKVADLLRAHGCWDDREFVTVDVDGILFVIVDICMRMLTPRERYTANGFPLDYIIDHGIDADGSIIRFTLEQQGHMCGNAVCPTEARDLVAANYQPREVSAPVRKRTAKPMEMFAFGEAAE
ncbi:DNA cytosine methyltransferase [Methylobrevis pamukkalensis]|uniref:DNA (cytosine-5-)-methyltransferase n=1 Tax=Methylobrevis pamukkalensis TaxID=1439726 RepID=A0A1E3H1I9_9HYPH|nr:DNA cytosine methyltransferase [Methylobrevis pamukkalensis]ODN70198.1 C-5 cytosine-specific DNA methylase [Methylobrevis pamukkalensis]